MTISKQGNSSRVPTSRRRSTLLFRLNRVPSRFDGYISFTAGNVYSPLGFFVAEVSGVVFAGEVSLVSDLSLLVVLEASVFSSEVLLFLPFLPA